MRRRKLRRLDLGLRGSRTIEKGCYTNGAKLSCGRTKTARVDCFASNVLWKGRSECGLHRGPEGEATMLKRDKQCLSMFLLRNSAEG